MREYQSGIAVVTSDSVALTDPTLALLVTTSGIVTVDMYRSGIGIPIYITAGIVCPIRVTKIYTTGTATTTGIVALW